MQIRSKPDVRQDTMRRMFYRWLSSAKQVRHRRMVLQEREEEARLYALEKAWDTWREKFKAERLKPLVRYIKPFTLVF